MVYAGEMRNLDDLTKKFVSPCQPIFILLKQGGEILLRLDASIAQDLADRTARPMAAAVVHAHDLQPKGALEGDQPKAESVIASENVHKKSFLEGYRPNILCWKKF